MLEILRSHAARSFQERAPSSQKNKLPITSTFVKLLVPLGFALSSATLFDTFSHSSSLELDNSIYAMAEKDEDKNSEIYLVDPNVFDVRFNISKDRSFDGLLDWKCRIAAFVSRRDNNSEIYAYFFESPESRTGRLVRITNNLGSDSSPSVANCHTILFSSQNDENNMQWDIYAFNMSDGKITQVTNDELQEFDIDRSPDGSAITYRVYDSSDTNPELYLISFRQQRIEINDIESMIFQDSLIVANIE